MKRPPASFSKDLTALIPRLRRYALVLTQRKEDAEDILQSTLERAIDKQQQWSEDSHLDRWAFTIMNSIWKNELRYQSTRKGNGVSYNASELGDISTKDNLDRTFLYQQVFKEVMQLPENQREAILLVYVEGMKYQQVADLLSIPLGTLMSRLARARIALSDKFTGTIDDYQLNKNSTKEISEEKNAVIQLNTRRGKKS